MKFVKVKSITEVPYKGFLYNLHVKKNHNYFANNILVSNCHQAKAVSIQEIAKKCVNADYRIGFTGTLPTDKMDNWTIQGYLGPVIYEKKSLDLIEKGVLSKITIANLILKYPKEIREKAEGLDYNSEIELINNFEYRNKILKFILNTLRDGQNTLILTRLITHIEAIKAYLTASYGEKFKIYVITGEIDTDERERIRKLVSKQGNVVILGSYGTCSTGLNIPKIHNVIFMSSYKSKIKVLQSIGRGLRLADSKDKLIVWDIVDDLRTTNKKNYMFQHFEERLKYYNQQGFKYISKEIELDKLQ